MSQSYVCTDTACYDLYLDTLGETIDHLRGVHGRTSIHRPHAVGVPDSRGHLWYCKCLGRLGKDHRSFNSHRAMWDHLNSKHDEWLETLRSLKVYEEDQTYQQYMGFNSQLGGSLRFPLTSNINPC